MSESLAQELTDHRKLFVIRKRSLEAYLQMKSFNEVLSTSFIANAILAEAPGKLPCAITRSFVSLFRADF